MDLKLRSVLFNIVYRCQTSMVLLGGQFRDMLEGRNRILFSVYLLVVNLSKKTQEYFFLSL